MKDCRGFEKNVWKRRKATTEAKMGMYNGMIVLRVLHGSETWEMNVRLRCKVDGYVMSCLTPISGVSMCMGQNDKFLH